MWCDTLSSIRSVWNNATHTPMLSIYSINTKMDFFFSRNPLKVFIVRYFPLLGIKIFNIFLEKRIEIFSWIVSLFEVKNEMRFIFSHLIMQSMKFSRVQTYFRFGTVWLFLMSPVSKETNCDWAISAGSLFKSPSFILICLSLVLMNTHTVSNRSRNEISSFDSSKWIEIILNNIDKLSLPK